MSPRALNLVACLCLAACGGSDGVGDGPGAGNGGATPLGAPAASFVEDFGTIQAVRELADGRVMVADPLGGALYVVDMDAGTREVIGTEGQGPGEYRQPDTVWPIEGDSTLVVDLGNARFMPMDADFVFGETSPLSAGDPRSGLIIALPQGVDAAGRIYAQRSMGGGMGGALPDSGAILRIERGSFAVDTVGSFKLEDRKQSVSGGPDNRNVSISPIPLSAQDAWGVADDGSVVVARSADYHVEWLRPDGSVVSGPPVPFTPVGIGTAEKEEWLAARGRSGGGIGVMLSIENGAMQTSFRRGGGMRMAGQGEPSIDDYEWPETKPPFLDGRIVVDPAGHAWVQRHVPAGGDATYDVFDAGAMRVATYTLPNNRRIVGFGEGTIYVVAFDEFDLNYLERYVMPQG
jgi:hypothetical protein